jgi:hypothetical protein
MWFAPAVWSMFAINFALIGARLCRPLRQPRHPLWESCMFEGVEERGVKERGVEEKGCRRKGLEKRGVEIGAASHTLSFLSCLAYGKFGITAVIRLALPAVHSQPATVTECDRQ